MPVFGLDDLLVRRPPIRKRDRFALVGQLNIEIELVKSGFKAYRSTRATKIMNYLNRLTDSEGDPFDNIAASAPERREIP
jgi:hypothetical protein